MTPTEALDRLAIMTAWDVEPTLTSAELATLVTIAQRADTAGLAPSNVDWVPTYDLNAAAAEGWRWKAAKAAAKFDISTDGQSLSRSQIIAQCQQMAAMYASRVFQTVRSSDTVTTI